MAEPATQGDLFNLYRDHSDIRSDIANEACVINANVKDTSYRALQATDAVGDRMISQIDKQFHAINTNQFGIARDMAVLAGKAGAEHVAVISAITSASKESALVAELNSVKMALEISKGQAAILDKVGYEGAETRKLINEQKYGDLNRALIERNSEIVECKNDSRHWRGNYDQAQYANLSSQLQAFQSQLTETRQGMVNFGTMAGVGQTSTANNVR